MSLQMSACSCTRSPQTVMHTHIHTQTWYTHKHLYTQTHTQVTTTMLHTQKLLNNWTPYNLGWHPKLKKTKTHLHTHTSSNCYATRTKLSWVTEHHTILGWHTSHTQTHSLRHTHTSNNCYATHTKLSWTAEHYTILADIQTPMYDAAILTIMLHTNYVIHLWKIIFNGWT